MLIFLESRAFSKFYIYNVSIELLYSIRQKVLNLKNFICKFDIFINSQIQI